MSVVAISALATFFSGEEKLIKRGGNALESNRLLSFVYDGSMGLIKGKVKASMKLKVYEVTVSCVILLSQVLFLIYSTVLNTLYQTKLKQLLELKAGGISLPNDTFRLPVGPF